MIKTLMYIHCIYILGQSHNVPIGERDLDYSRNGNPKGMDNVAEPILCDIISGLFKPFVDVLRY